MQEVNSVITILARANVLTDQDQIDLFRNPNDRSRIGELIEILKERQDGLQFLITALRQTNLPQNRDIVDRLV